MGGAIGGTAQGCAIGQTRASSAKSGRSGEGDFGLSKPRASGIGLVPDAPKKDGEHMSRSATRRSAFLPTLEPLEPRELLANSIAFNAVTRVLAIDGSSVNDVVKVAPVGSTVQATMTHPGKTLAPQSLTVTGPIAKITFLGYDGDDYFENRTAAPVVADGGKGNDNLIGGAG